MLFFLFLIPHFRIARHFTPFLQFSIIIIITNPTSHLQPARRQRAAAWGKSEGNGKRPGGRRNIRGENGNLHLKKTTNEYYNA